MNAAIPDDPDAPLPSVWGLAGLPEPELRPDDQAPPVDHRLVADLAAERLRDDPDLADYVWDLVRHFRPWRDAYARTLRIPTHPPTETPPLIERDGPTPGVVVPFSTSPTPAILANPPRLRRRWVALSVLAACILVGLGVGLGRWLMPGPPPRPSPREFLLASVTPLPGEVRAGAPAELAVDPDGAFRVPAEVVSVGLLIQSPRAGYAAVLVFGPDPTTVYPRPGNPDVRVEPFTPRTFRPLLRPSADSTVAVVVTAAPATEQIRRALPGRPVPPADVGAVLDEVVNKLVNDGQEWAAVSRVTLRPTKEK